MNDPNPAPSLYEQIGGHEGLLQLLRPFYIDIRQHDILGPIFNSHIEDWESYLQKITKFWALQTGGPSTYRGGFAGAHMRLGLQPEFIARNGLRFLLSQLGHAGIELLHLRTAALRSGTRY